MKYVLVTGGAGGMGLATCQYLRSFGFHVFALDIQPVSLQGVTGILCDLTDPASVKEAYDIVLSHTASLDAIVHTAGIYDLDSLVEIDENRFRKIFEINVFGAYRINHTFSPLLKEDGRIIIVTSELAPLDPLPFTGVYAITKSALERYAHSLRTELSLRNIHVSVIRPGAVKTGLLNVSTDALTRFCEKTQYYKCNAKRFHQIVDSVESRTISTDRIAKLVAKALFAKHPRFVYNINRNPLLRILAFLPDRMQQFILKMILK